MLCLPCSPCSALLCFVRRRIPFLPRRSPAVASSNRGHGHIFPRQRNGPASLQCESTCLTSPPSSHMPVHCYLTLITNVPPTHPSIHIFLRFLLLSLRGLLLLLRTTPYFLTSALPPCPSPSIPLPVKGSYALRTSDTCLHAQKKLPKPPSLSVCHTYASESYSRSTILVWVVGIDRAGPGRCSPSITSPSPSNPIRSKS